MTSKLSKNLNKKKTKNKMILNNNLLKKNNNNNNNNNEVDEFIMESYILLYIFNIKSTIFIYMMIEFFL